MAEQSTEGMIEQDAKRITAATDVLCELHAKHAAGSPNTIDDRAFKRARAELFDALRAALSRAHPGLTVRNFKP